MTKQAKKATSKNQTKPKKVTKPTGSRTKPKSLTYKQQHYCRCRASGMNMSDSYREAYSTKNMANKTINEEASRVDKIPEIAARIDYLFEQKNKAFIRSSIGLKDKVLTKLEDMMDNATPQDGNKIRATELLGKSIGLFKEVIEDSKYSDRSPEELTEILEQKLAELGSEGKTIN